MRILIATPHVFAGGAEKAALNLAHRLNEMGCEVGMATLSLDLENLPSYFGKLDYILPEEQIPPSVMDSTSATMASTFRELYHLTRLLRAHTDDYEIINPCNFPSYWAAFLAKKSKPTVWTSSEVFGPYNQTSDLLASSTLFRFALGVGATIDRLIVRKGIDDIVTCSEINSGLIRDRYKRPSHVIPTGVDYDFFSRDLPDAKEKLGLEESTLLLHVGTLVERKNQILSIRALRDLKPSMENVKLALVGSGPWERRLRKEVQRLGVEEDVIFAGTVSEDTLNLYYHACDVNLFPVVKQTHGLVPFEALVAGKISVVSRECGAAKFIEENGIGFVMKGLEPAEIAEMTKYALTHEDEVRDMVERGKRFVEENLTWKVYADRMHGLFQEALSKHA